MPSKRKRSLLAAPASPQSTIDVNPDHNTEIIDGKAALRASPDAEETGDLELERRNNRNPKALAKKQKKPPTKSSLAAKKGAEEIKAFKENQAASKVAESNSKSRKDDDEWVQRLDPEADEATAVEDIDTIKNEARRPPPVNSGFLPLPWKGRLGYACLNTYLRQSSPPIFSSRTCRIASILEHRHPLSDPTQPEHPTKNRPCKTMPASIDRGQQYVEALGLANARDIIKMLRWNDKYGIKFLRLSSEMFPFASHSEYGYKLAPFASETLAEVGRVAAELGHRLSTHPGQFTQLGSPRAEVISNAIRDLEYHDEMLSLLKLPPQSDRDAVMILHLGGTFGDKAATLDRFRANYKALSPSVKNRLILENDDVSWSVHDLLPVCEELTIPLCLDFHHHNIIFEASQVREGTLDIIEMFPRIKATWDIKQITQKMHYSEATPEAITGRQRRKHNPRPSMLPPCPVDMDLMIEAKDKEQAVFELMRRFRLPGWDTFNDIIPYERGDDNRVLPKKAKKKSKKQIKDEIEEFGKELSEAEEVKEEINEEEIGMGGEENRVYWPTGMEEWLRPKKREVKKKGAVDEEEMFKNPTPSNLAARRAVMARKKEPLNDNIKERLNSARSVADVEKILTDTKTEGMQEPRDEEGVDGKPKRKTKTTSGKKKTNTNRPTQRSSSVDDEDEADSSFPDLSDEEEEPDQVVKTEGMGAVERRKSGRARDRKKSYAEPGVDSGED